MKLASIRTVEGTRAVIILDEQIYRTEFESIDLLLKAMEERSKANTFNLEELLRAYASACESISEPNLAFAPLVGRGSKVFCVGVNYRAHVEEMGREIPDFPTIFTKFPQAFVGSGEDLIAPRVSETYDYEGELGVIVGRTARNISPEQACDYIAGFTICMDGSLRQWQNQTSQWTAGKNWEKSSSVGPYLVLATEEPHARLTTRVNGVKVQEGYVDEVIFHTADVLSYISTFITLEPGDLIMTGTPSGVGHARKPLRYLRDADLLEIEIEGLGILKNTVRG